MTTIAVPVPPGGTVYTVETLNGRPCVVGHDVTHITVHYGDKGELEISATYDYFGSVKTALPSMLGVSVFTDPIDAMNALDKRIKKEKEARS